jgi:hypothetical protein
MKIDNPLCLSTGLNEIWVAVLLAHPNLVCELLEEVDTLHLTCIEAHKKIEQ